MFNTQRFSFTLSLAVVLLAITVAPHLTSQQSTSYSAGTATQTMGATTFTGAATFQSTVAMTGALTPTGGLVQNSATANTYYYTGGGPPAAATTGTDTAAINGTVFISSVVIPANSTLTGISYLLGSVGGTDKVAVALFDSAGNVVANSALDSSVTAGTTATFQRVPFTATYASKGPGLFFIGVMFNGSTAKLRTTAMAVHPTTSVSQTFNTLVAITPPTTFTASVGPIASTY